MIRKCYDARKLALMGPPTTIAHYRITAKLGEGGMGEVWRAIDTKLNREVAIKILPEAFAADPDRLARFTREAQVLALLNHPNIAAIYGVEDRAIVMELVEGQNPAGPLSWEEALPLVQQLIDALEYAHDKGVVHRDLKPANLKVTPDRRLKVLDFGLAKALASEAGSPDPATSKTLTMNATVAGVIMGTAGYMSPEQARGHAIDRRADIWAFGVIVWELLMGWRLFEGTTVSDTLAAVLTRDPDFDAAPPQARRLLRLCLARDVRQRLGHISAARVLLEEAPAAPRPARRTPLPWAVAVLATAIAGVALWGWLHPKPPESRQVMRFAVTAPVQVSRGIALSRDGSRLAFVGGPRTEIYVRSMDQLEAKPLPGTEGTSLLCFSPDGQWIIYITGERSTVGGHLSKIAVAGGPAQVLADVSSVRGPPGQDWGEDDSIVFASEGVLYRIPASGGKPETIATPDAAKGETSLTEPQFLPGGHWILCRINSAAAVLNLQTREKKILLEGAGHIHYASGAPGSSTGYIVYYAPATGSLMAVAFDLKKLAVKGSPIRVLDGVQSYIGPFGAFGFSDSGTLAYVPGVPGSRLRRLVWVDRQGVEQAAPATPRAYRSPRLSPDGQRVAVDIGVSADDTQRADIWVGDLIRGTWSRITSENRNFSPVWTPDGKRLIYGSGDDPARMALVSAPADGSSPPPAHPVSEPGPRRNPESVSPDGRLLIGRNFAGVGVSGNDFWVLSLVEGSSAVKPHPFLDSRFSKTGAQFSPDGQWVAYASRETGSSQIYVTPYPGPGGTHPVSTDGGTLPRWARSGRELFYVNGGKMMVVEIQTSPVFRAGIPKMLFEKNRGAIVYPDSGNDVSPDGKRFLMVQQEAAPQAPRDQLHVVVNWFEELRRLAPAGGK
jgi:Tol biopolymer transport system component